MKIVYKKEKNGKKEKRVQNWIKGCKIGYNWYKIRQNGYKI